MNNLSKLIAATLITITSTTAIADERTEAEIKASQGNLQYQICSLESSMAEKVMRERQETNDPQHTVFQRYLEVAPDTLPMITAAFRRPQESKWFSNDREKAISDFKNAWFSVCLSSYRRGGN